MGKVREEAVPAVSGWRARRGLLLAVVLPAAALASFGAVHLAGALSSAGSAARAGALATLTADSARLAAALEAERDQTVRFVALGSSPFSDAGRGSVQPRSDGYRLELAVLRRAYAATDGSARQVTAAARAIGGSYPAAVRQQAASELAALGRLADLRRAATTTNLPSLDIISEYASVIGSVLAAGDNTSPGRGEQDLTRYGTELSLIAGAREDVAQQGAILISALGPDLDSQGSFGPDKLGAITAAISEEESARVAFDSLAGPAQRQQFQHAMSAPPVTRAQAMVQQAIALARSGQQDPTIGDAATGQVYVQAGLSRVEAQLESAEQSTASALHSRAVLEAVGYSLLLAVLAAMLFTVFRPRLPRRA
jgi:lysophospholipase L1-like esterase